MWEKVDVRRPLLQLEERRQEGTRKWIFVRAVSVVAIFVLAYFILIVRSYCLHLGHDPRLTKLASAQYLKKIVLAPERGTIYDRNGRELAVDVQVYSIFAHPTLMPNADKKPVAEVLAKVLALNGSELLTKFQSGKHFVWVERRISEEQKKAVDAAKLPGVFSVPEKKRYYPNGALAGQILGAVGYDAEALGGIELAYDSYLKSKQESYLLEKDARGRSYLYSEGAGKKDFADVTLSIDRDIQYIAERELQAAVEKYHPTHGFVMVAKPDTGELLAVANAPSFDPNHYADFPIETWRNYAFLDVYEPGSTFKAITAAAALHSGKVTPESTFFCENGSWNVANRVIHDHHGYGTMPFRDIIKVSSNIGMAKVEQSIGRETFISMISNLGFGHRSFLAFPGESAGMLQNFKTMGSVEEATMAFGQGIAVSGLQMIQAYGAFANGGSLMKPFMVRSVVDRDQEVIAHHTEPTVVRKVLSASEAKTLSDMLHGVVEKGGTAPAAALENYKVAGKTGTAQKVINAVYAPGKFVSSFIGYAPVDHPQLLVYVVLDEPKPLYFGGVVAAPLFHRIADQALNHLGVMGDTQLAGEPLTAPPAQTSTLKKPSQPPTPPAVALASTTALAPEKTIAQSLSNGVTPDLSGLSLREILPPFNRFPYGVESRGVGFVVGQSPQPGSLLTPGESVQVVLSPNERG